MPEKVAPGALVCGMAEEQTLSTAASMKAVVAAENLIVDLLYMLVSLIFK
jgi:hypothetical protein